MIGSNQAAREALYTARAGQAANRTKNERALRVDCIWMRDNHASLLKRGVSVHRSSGISTINTPWIGHKKYNEYANNSGQPFLANVNSCSRSLYVVVLPSVVCLSSVTFVHPTQAIEIFGNVSTPFGTLAICDPSVKILLRSSKGNPSVVGLNQRGVEKCSDFGPFQGYISETVQDRR